MIDYTIYDEQGRILRVGTCPDADAPFQCKSGEFAIVGKADFRSDRVVDGVVCALPERPSLHHTFNYAEGRWEDLRTLDELKSLKRSEINASRTATNQSSFSFAGREIACDALSRSDIDGVNGEVALTGTLPASFPGAWKAKDNTYVAIPDVATWTAFYQAMTAQGTANFLHAQALKAQVASATTIVEVDSIVW